MAIHIGWRAARWAGLVVAGVGFILPAMVITGGARVGVRALRHAARGRGWLLYGVKPVILAIVVAGAVEPGAGREHAPRHSGLGGAAAVAGSAAGANELADAVRVRCRWSRRLDARGRPGGAAGSSGRPALAARRGRCRGPLGGRLPGLFWVFLKIGSVLFGSGYVLLAFLRADLVERLHWLTEAQLIDAIAVGPGHARARCSRRRRSSATCSRARPARSWRRRASSCPRSSSSRSAGRWCRACGRSPIAGALPRRRQRRVARAHGGGDRAARAAPRSWTVPTVVLGLVGAALLLRSESTRAGSSWGAPPSVSAPTRWASRDDHIRTMLAGAMRTPAPKDSHQTALRSLIWRVVVFFVAGIAVIAAFVIAWRVGGWAR